MSHFETLGLPENASDKEIKQAYRSLAKKYHPDLNKAPDAAKKFIQLNQSYEWLTNGRFQNVFIENKETFNPANEFDLDGDGKLSHEEWRAMRNSKLREAARAFYNMHQTDSQFRLELWKHYALRLSIIIVPIWFWLFLATHSRISAIFWSGIIFLPAFVQIFFFVTKYGKSAKEYRTYIKIIRLYYQPGFKILGVFWF
jgi:hypothetical protein